jgi:hypothetical protein
MFRHPSPSYFKDADVPLLVASVVLIIFAKTIITSKGIITR